MTIKERKVWGETELIISTPSFEVHKIQVKKNGYCSKHKHIAKINSFYILKGKLEVVVWKPSGLVDTTLLEEGDFMVVSPQQFHRFKALEDTEALEIYWVDNLDPNDIIREIKGGRD